MSWQSRKEVIIRSYTPFGKRDHYAHFILDMLIPVWHWLWQNGIERKEDFVVYYWDGAAHYYTPMLDAFFTCKMRHMYLLDDADRPQRVVIVGMEGHCRKTLGLEMKYFFGNAKPFLNALHEYVCERFDFTPREHPNILLHVCREMDTKEVDRGGKRRGTSNESELGDTLRLVAAERELEYKKVSLAGMRFAKQIEVFMNSKVVVAQHGAALANLFWMRKGTHLCEYHWNHKEEYRKKTMCKRLGQPIHAGFKGNHVKPNVVEAPCKDIADYIMEVV